jgi:hypothetical protein
LEREEEEAVGEARGVSAREWKPVPTVAPVVPTPIAATAAATGAVLEEDAAAVVGVYAYCGCALEEGTRARASGSGSGSASGSLVPVAAIAEGGMCKGAGTVGIVPDEDEAEEAASGDAAGPRVKGDSLPLPPLPLALPLALALPSEGEGKEEEEEEEV